jgi:peptidoglycan/LPS O-acetylase OafA/YrhL
VATAVAGLSFRYFESPILRLKKRYERRDAQHDSSQARVARATWLRRGADCGDTEVPRQEHALQKTPNRRPQ